MATTTPSTRLLDNYVAGRWTPATGDDALDVTNPATGETIARARKLFELREGLVARSDELARSVTTEMGKTLPDARAEVARMIEMVECACALPSTMQGRVLEDVARNVDAETIRQPVGVCAAIVPFNFPAMVPFWFLPFAIGCGNTFVLKPSEQVPMTQQIAFEVLDGLGLPADAVIDKTVNGIIGSAFGAAGQRCMAGSVVVTVGDAHDKLLPPLREATESLQVGEAIELVNSSRFGNGTSIFTESGASVRRYRHEVEAGMIGVNIGVAAPVAFFPFSGWKDSFLGDLHAHGPDAVEFFTRKKTVTTRYFSSGQTSGAYFVEQ